MLTLYTHPFSTPALAVLMTARAIGVEFKHKVIDLTKQEQRTAEFLAVNPKGKVPAMTDGNLHLSESAAIMRYLARREGSPLLPSEPKAQAKVDQWMDFVMHHIRTPFSHVQFGRMFAPLFGQEPNQAAIKSGLDQLTTNLAHIDANLSRSKYLCGETMTLADIALIAALDPANAINLDLSTFKAVTAYLKRERASDWYKSVHNHYAEEMGMKAH